MEMGPYSGLTFLDSHPTFKSRLGILRLAGPISRERLRFRLPPRIPSRSRLQIADVAVPALLSSSPIRLSSRTRLVSPRYRNWLLPTALPCTDMSRTL